MFLAILLLIDSRQHNQIFVAQFKILDRKYQFKKFIIQSNLYPITILGTTQKWLPWISCCLIKHLYKKHWPNLVPLSRFFSYNECLKENKYLLAILCVLVKFLKIKNGFSYFWFWTYIHSEVKMVASGTLRKQKLFLPCCSILPSDDYINVEAYSHNRPSHSSV